MRRHTPRPRISTIFRRPEQDNKYTRSETTAISGVDVEQVNWKRDARTEVELIAIHGGGHGLPQPYYRRARLPGPSPMAPNGAEMIWEFFTRQGR